MNKQQNPEIARKLIDALIQSVIERGFSLGIDEIALRAGVNSTSAYSLFTSRSGLAVAALERVGSEVRKNLKTAMERPDSGGIFGDSSLSRIVDRLVEHLSDHDNPIGFITSCLVSYPDPKTKIHAAAMKEHAGIVGWLANIFRTIHVMPYPENTANALMAVIHGTSVNVLGGVPHTQDSSVQTRLLLWHILLACMKEKTATSSTPKSKGK